MASTYGSLRQRLALRSASARIPAQLLPLLRATGAMAGQLLIQTRLAPLEKGLKRIKRRCVLAARRRVASPWQRRTNVWQKVTSPTLDAKRLRSGSANERLSERARRAMTLQEAKSIARHLGLTLRKVRSGEYRVNFRDGNETTAYYTDNLEDAVNTAVEMTRRRAL